MTDSKPPEETKVAAPDTSEPALETLEQVEADSVKESAPSASAADEIFSAEANSSETLASESSGEQEAPGCDPTTCGETVDGPSEREQSDPSIPSRDVGDVLVSRIDEMQAALDARLQNLEAATTQLTADADERTEYRTNREALYEKLEASTTNFHFQLLRPILQRISLLYDLVSDLRESPPEDQQAAFQLVHDNLRDVMEINGVDTISPSVEEKFDRRFHHVVTTECTSDQTKHELIARTVTDGFLYFGQNERTGALRPSVIRPARVVMWKYDPNLEPRCESTEAASPREQLSDAGQQDKPAAPVSDDVREESSSASTEEEIPAASTGETKE